MKYRVLALVVPFFFLATICKTANSDEMQSLFDGKSLKGWTRIGGKADVWKVTPDGLLVMSGEGGGWLAADGEYADFEFSLEFQLTPDSNSGVYLRAPADTSHISRTGMEIQILDDFHPKYANVKPWQRTGSIYHVAAAKTGFLKKAGQWNEMQIKAEGAHVVIYLNGQKIVDDMIDSHPELNKEHTGLARKSGKIGLQSHNGVVSFRNIKAKRL
ncbi:MAG: hypothetical protein RJA81_2029 [Planctomycetota bacterium]|jgi:hypothetical protein